MKPIRKLLCIILSVLTIVTSAPVASALVVITSNPIKANADIIYERPETITSKNYRWKYQVIYSDNSGQDYIQINSYTGLLSTITVPDEIDGKIVKGISEGFLNSSSKLKVINVSQGIEFIDYKAFSNTANYITLNLPSSLKYIASQSFYNAKIETINFSEGLKMIGTNAFELCEFSDKELVLPNSLEALGYDAFKDATITSIHFGEKVNIARNANFSKVNGTCSITYDENYNNFFNKTKGLKYITVDDSNPYFASQNNCLYSKNMKVLYKACCGDLAKVDEFILNDNVEMIICNAFYGTAPINCVMAGKNLKKISRLAFLEAKVNSIDFSNDTALKTIDNSAFKGALLNSDLLIPASVETIGEYAFAQTQITSLSFENESNCKSIYSYAFSQCKSLKNVEIPSSVTVLGNSNDKPQNNGYSPNKYPSNTFENCSSLESFTIDENSQLEYLGFGVLNNCTSLKSFSIGKNSSLKGISTSFGNTQIEVLDLSNCSNLVFIYESSFESLKKLKSVNLENTQIVNIEPSTFEFCVLLESVVLSNSTESIDEYAFAYCSKLSKINIDNVAKISENAFKGCTNLNIDYSDKIEKKYNDFKYYKSNDSIFISGYTGADKNLVIPDTIENLPVTKIYDGVFKGKVFDSVSFPNQLTYIGKEAFYNCKIKEVPTFPDTLVSIGESAFDCCDFNGKLLLPKNLDTVEKYAFARNKSTEIIVGANTQTIDDYAFFACSAIEIDFGDGVKEIGNRAVDSCFDLATIKFGKNVSNINAIFNKASFDSSIENIFVSEKNSAFADINGVLYNKNITELIYYPWARDDENFVIPNTVSKIDDYAFAYNSAVNIDLSNVKEIGEYAFYNSFNLSEIYIPSTVTKIGDSCFEKSEALEKVNIGAINVNEYTDALFFNCTKLKEVNFDKNATIKGMVRTFCKTNIESIILPENVSCMRQTFSNVTSLKSIKLPKNLDVLGQNALYNTSVENVIVPSATLTVCEKAFGDCKYLKYVDISNVTTIEKQAFENCISLEAVDLTSVLSLSKFAFVGCDNLKKFYFTAEEKEAYIAENEFKGNENLETVVIGNSITEIQNGAFADCTNLKTVLIANGVDNISDTAFENCDKLTIVCMYASPAMYYAEKNDIAYETFVISPIADQNYTGKPITPNLDVKQAGKKLAVDKDYSAVYSDNVNVGVAKVAVAGLGDYSIFGATVKFNIVGKNEENQIKPDDTKKAENKADTSNQANSNLPENKQPTAQVEKSENETSNSQSIKNNDENVSSHNAKPEVTNEEKTQTSKSQLPSSAEENGENVSENDLPSYDKSEDKADVINDGEINNDLENKKDQNTEDEKPNISNTNKKDGFFTRVLKVIIGFFKSIINTVKSLFDK